MDYRVLLIAPLAAVVLSVSAANPRLPAGWQNQSVASTADPKSAGRSATRSASIRPARPAAHRA